MSKSRRPRKGRTKPLINLIKQRLDSQVRRKTIRAMAKDFKSGFRTIGKVLTEDFKKKYYRKINVQRLKQDQKSIRKSCCIWIRKNINRNKVASMMFNR